MGFIPPARDDSALLKKTDEIVARVSRSWLAGKNGDEDSIGVLVAIYELIIVELAHGCANLRYIIRGQGFYLDNKAMLYNQIDMRGVGIV